jgi:hypothetical protein
MAFPLVGVVTNKNKVVGDNTNHGLRINRSLQLMRFEILSRRHPRNLLKHTIKMHNIIETDFKSCFRNTFRLLIDQ